MKLKIFYLYANPIITRGPGGEGHKTHILETIRSFQKMGCQVIQLPRMNITELSQKNSQIVSIKPFLSDRLRCIGRDIIYLAKNYNFSKEVDSILRNNHIDFIYERYYIFQFAGAKGAKRFGVPIILEINSPLYEAKNNSGMGFEFFAKFIEKKVAQSVDAIVVVSSVVHDYMVQLGIDINKIHVIHNGVDALKFNPNISGEMVRKFYHLDGETVVGFVGSFIFYHGTDILLAVAEEIVREEQNICFLFVGGENEKFYDTLKYLQNNHLENRIVLTGKIPYDRVPEYIAAMDITVLPNATDYGFPIKLCEYGGIGKPIVAPRVKPIEEVFENGETALLFELGDKKALKNSIMALVKDNQLRKELGTKVYKHIIEHHTWDANAKKIIDIYESLQ